MRVVNRCAVVVTPKQPFLNWLHRIDPSSHDIKMGDLRRDPSVYLFPECNDDRGLTKLLKKGCLEIFEKELESWDRIEESWPKDRSFAAFRRWFDYSIHWMVFDITHQPAGTGGNPITISARFEFLDTTPWRSRPSAA